MRCGRYLIAALLFASAGVAQADHDRAAQVRCHDGTTSPAGRDACAGHGGMAKDEGALTPTKITPASIDSDEDKKLPASTAAVGSPAQVRCKDGTMAAVERGACSDRGGIDRATGAAPRAIPGAAPSPPAEKESKAHNPKSELTANPPVVTPDGTTAIARCEDGTLAEVSRHSATCSGHGGVSE